MVAWIQKEHSIILTVGNHVITRNPRVSVTHDGHRTWFLGIKDVQPRDAGTYMCQINTESVISQIGYLNVNGKSNVISQIGYLNVNGKSSVE
ncbi:hypothetical protein HAZT_HAZT002107 [Hyalella azteca]|uniref:Ig-like domain-containing protein n=1 Tax=Hyalella azteca TaxID=294128 RepID=A0A6A0GNU8_HYAAZ|nr:hypothetical protein HAZT_HAZT002107 [Hyalella azteca]